MFVQDEGMDKKELTRLQEEGQNLADKLVFIHDFFLLPLFWVIRLPFVSAMSVDFRMKCVCPLRGLLAKCIRDVCR